MNTLTEEEREDLNKRFQVPEGLEEYLEGKE